MALSTTTIRQLAMLLRMARLRAGLDQTELARRLGISQPTVSRWEGSGIRPPRVHLESWLEHCRDGLAPEVVLALTGLPARLDDPEADELALSHEIRRLARLVAGGAVLAHEAQVPCYADVAAGMGECQEQRMAARMELSVPRHVFEQDPGSYALRVFGDSMSPQLLDGDIVVVSPAAPLIDGCTVAAYLEPDGDVVKLYRQLPDGGALLVPANPRYPAVMLTAEGEREGRIWGRVVLVQRDL